MELYKQRKRKLSGRKVAQWYTVKVPSPEQESEEIPFLELKAFSKPTHITFDKVKVGTSKTRTLHVNNPLNVAQTVYFEKFPFEKNYDVDKQKFCVPASGTCTIDITWNPEKSVSCRETVLFKTSVGLRVQAYLHGTAYSPKKQKKKNFNQGNVQVKQKTLSKNSQICDFTEGKKENLCPPIENVASSLLPNLFPTPQSRTSLNPINVFSDSPIRRQTYTINSMLRESSIGVKGNAVTAFSLFNQNKNEIVLHQKQVESHLIPNSLPSQSSKLGSKKTIINSIIATENDSKEILNDSLEISPTDPSLDNNTSLLASCSINSMDYDVTSSSVTDPVTVFDSSAKHFYFGYTPQVKANNVVSSALCNSFCFKTDNNEEGKLNDNNCSFVLNQANAKSRMLLSAMSPDKRLTFTAAFANTNTSLTLPNVIKYPQANNDFLQVDYIRHKSALPFNIEPFNDSLCEHAPVTDQDYKDSLSPEVKNCTEAIMAADFLPQSSSLPPYNDYVDADHKIGKLHSTAVVNELDVIEESDVAIAFQLKSDFSQPFKIPLNKQSLSTAKQEQPSKLKHKNVVKKNSGRKLIRELKLSNTSSTSLKKSPDVSLAAKISQTVQEANVDTLTSDKHNKKSTRLVRQRSTLGKRKCVEMYQPNPYASSNAYYDEYWKEKQEAAFTNVLNFILTPNDDFHSSEEVKVNCAEIWIESMKDTAAVTVPSKEDLSFKAYTTAKQLRQLRETACRLYQSEKLAQVIEKVEREVEINKISIRKDRAIQADLGIKKDLLEMLLSYNPLWLRIGLETVYGEIISLQSNRDVVGLSRFIINRFLSNPAITTKYGYTSIRNYFKPGYEDEMKRFTLKKFFLLVFFLDEAKRAHLINHNPCLFCKSSKYKCSRDLLLTFSREYLSGEGDITKHLRYLGYVVSYEQKPIEEFDYAVRNIAIDLRCGLRLGRVVELLLQDWAISKSLRVNTLNRLTKIHNNDVILKSLAEASINIEGNIDPRDIVDGNREKTLSLLWQIIFKTQIAKNVNLEGLKKENSHLRRSLKLNADFAAFEALQKGYGEAKESEKDFYSSKLYKENEVIQQLLQWCQNVAAHYGVKVYNFTSSFADGRVLCLLLHHYHPNLLSREKIKMETSSSYYLRQIEASEDEDVFLSDSKELTSGLKDKLLKNDKENLELVFQKFQEIGQIPLHVPNTRPDEKVMITLVSYINIRLMEISVVIRAARTILFAYRRWCLRKKQEKLKIQITAAKTIQRSWRKYMTCKKEQKEEQSATIIQQCWKRYAAKKLLKHLKQERHMKFINQNTIVIQAAWRGYLTRKHQLKCEKAAIVLQKNIRKWLSRNHFMKLKEIAVRIQNIYRANVLGHSQRLEYLQMKSMVIHCQAIAKGYLVRNQIKRQISAAIVIQSQFRGFTQRSKFRREKAACLIIQSHLRRIICRKLFLKQKNAVTILQSHLRATLIARETRMSYLKDLKSVVMVQALVRGWLVRKHMHKMNCSATKIQTLYRSFVCRRLYLQQKQSVIILQREIRSYLQKKAKERQKSEAAVVIQSCFRSYIAKRKFLKMKSACVRIQAHFRRHVLQKLFWKQKNAAISLQKHFRAYLIGKSTRESYINDRKCIVAVQALARGWLVRKYICKLNLSATKVQSRYRSFICKRNYLKMKRSAIILQRCFRSYLCKKETERRNLNAAIVIQSTVRGYIARLSFKKQKCACLVIQSYLRTSICRKQFLKQKKAAIIIQNRYKAYKIGTRVRNCYLNERKKVVIAQAVTKGWLIRKYMSKLHTSATIIQVTYRSYICQKKYLRMKRSAIILQRCVKSYLSKIATEKRNCAAAVVIQSTFRGYIKKLTFRRQKSACIVIQSCLRKHICRKQYLKRKKAAIAIQSQYRAYRIGTKTRSSYIKDREQIIVAQAVVRGWLTRRNILKLNRSATAIQAAFRSYICQKKYFKKKQSAITVQRCVRSYLCKKAIEREKNSAAVVIQSNFKGYIEKLKFRRQRSACIVIQSHLRKYICRNRYLVKRKAVISIQTQYRALKTGTKVRNCYLKTLKHIITAQAIVKGWLTRRRMHKLNRSAITIQATFRSYICKKNYLEKKQSAIIIQSYIRFYLRRKMIEKRNFAAAVVIQSNFKCYFARLKFRRQKSACVVIQSHLKRYICRKQFLKQKKAAITIQSQYRAFKTGMKVRKCYLTEMTQIITVQSFVKGWLVRRHTRRLNNSATIIQTTFKSYICRKIYIKKKQSAIIVQRCIRSYLCKKATERRNVAAAIVIQSSYRGYIERLRFNRQKSACIVIQSYLRKHIIRSLYLKQKEAAVAIQIRFRATLLGIATRKVYINDRRSVVSIQAVVRGWLTRRHLNKLHSSATKIQSTFRSYICKKYYLKKKHSVIILQHCIKSYLYQKAIERKRIAAASVIQASYRGYTKRLAFRKDKAACIIIQSNFRRYICQKQFVQQKWAANVIQKHYKNILTRRIYRKNYLHIRKCIITAQSIVRGWITRRRIKQLQYSAIKIQTIYRAYICRERYLKKRQSVVTIQKHCKNYIQSKGIRTQYLIIRQSAILIQSAWRAYKIKSEFSRKRSAAILLQCHMRKVLAQKRFLKLKQSATVIQRYYLAYRSGLKEYHLYKEKRKSCIKMQACVRGYIVRQRIKRQTNAAIVIQQSFRRWKEVIARSEAIKMDLQYVWYSNLRASIVKFQLQARYVIQKRARAAVLIQSYVRMWLARKKRAALKIQALWRGYLVRRSQNSEKLSSIRRNIHKVYDKHQQLAHRTTRALDTLQSMNLRNILHALINLDACTRLSPTCCERLKESGGLSKLIQLIESCNRSIPHRDIIKLAINILLNLAKYQKTVDAVWREPDALNVILKLMKIYHRDKTVPIFSKCCSLFWIFNQDPEKAQVLQQNSVFIEEMKKLSTSLMRNKEINDQRCTKNAAGWNCSIIQKSLNSRESLVIDPDWILGQHRRREFIDPFVAISSLIHSLGL